MARLKEYNGHYCESEYEYAFIGFLEAEGWIYSSGNNISRVTKRDVLIADDFKKFISDTNSELTEDEVTQIFDNVRLVGSESDFATLHKVYGWMVDGVQFTPQDGLARMIPLIDFENWDKNIFRVVNQFTVEYTNNGQKENRRPDVLLFVNGMPLCVIELKNPADANATIYDAWEQINIRYWRDIPHLLHYCPLACISDGVKTRLGTVRTPYEHFYAWRRVNEGDTVSTLPFEETETMIKGVYAPERFLEIFRDYIYFQDSIYDSDEVEIVCRYPQFFAARLLKQSIINSVATQSGKGGTYFGATGCGKTYTMAFLARQLALRCTDIPEIGSPTIILIVDRDELQKQGAKLFTKSTEFLNLGEVSVVKNRAQLRQELGARQSGGFYICTIQKFCDREDDKIGLINDRQNIICFSDEAHRTQLEHSKKIQFSKDADENMKAMVSKPYAKVLKEAFPQATFVGFTGTPIAETYQTFGDEIDRYTMDQAVADGLTVSIKYHPRIAKVLLDKVKVKEIEDYYKKCADDGATYEDIEASKKAMSSMEVILGEPSRLERLATDIHDHYISSCAGDPDRIQKAMVVCSNRKIAYALLQKFKDKYPEWFEEKKSPDGVSVTEEELKELKPMPFIAMVSSVGSNDEEDMYNYLGGVKNDKRSEELDAAFKQEKSNFHIVIVVDMWITGFDVPCLTYLYNDKPLKKHLLIQTISRVNRKYPGKEFGMVIDYIGIRDNMREAMKVYGGDTSVAPTSDDVEQATSVFREGGVKLDYIDIIEKSIYNIDSKICGIIDDYKVLQDSQKVADYVIQFLRTYLEHIAARIYAHENPNKQVPIRGKDKWYTQYMKPLKENNEYGYIWNLHHSLQITTSHYVPAEDGAIRLMDGYLSQLYQLRDQMREKFGLVLMSNLDEYPQEKNSELDPYYEKIYFALKGIHLEYGTKHTNDRYYITRKKYRTVNGKGFFEYTLSYAQEEITKFDRFVAYSFNDIPDNYSIQCDFAQANVDFNGVDIDIKCLIAWNVSIRPCELEKLAAICGYEIKVRSDNLYYKALMKFLSRTGMNLMDILLADEGDYEIYIQQVELSKKPELEETFDKIREIIIGEKPGSNILRYITAYLKNDVIRDQLSDRSNNRLSYLYLKNEAIPFDEMPYASSLCGHNLLKSRLHKCLEIYNCEHQYVSAMVNREAYDSNTLYVTVDENQLDYYQYEVEKFNQNLYESTKQQLRKIETFTNHLYVKNYYEITKSVIEKLQQYTSEGVDGYSDMLADKAEFMNEIDDVEKQKILENIFINSRLGMVYGAAGTGKTRVAEYIAKLFDDKNILLLANTNAAKNNLERRINSSCDCYTVYDYLKNGYSWKRYDLVILDECSTVCNEDVFNLFEKCNAEAYLLLGDIYQIEAIKFGNWFSFARYFVDKKSVYELSTPYRAKDKAILLDMWTCVRKFDENMFERLQANGFISTLNESIFEKDDEEIILCLGYDGLYGVNNINRYMQKINPSKPIEWGNWTYKVGDKVLFNESRRFGNVLYNNLKGRILSIDKKTDEIVFQVLVDKVIDKTEAGFAGIKLVECAYDDKSIVEFNVKRRVERDSDADYSEEIVPFQIAYAVSIHKAQGLEYESVKVVITEDVDERISHNIFYTAITRTTDRLKIYMSKETQNKLAEKFVKSNVGLQQAQLFAGHAGLKLKNKLSS